MSLFTNPKWITEFTYNNTNVEDTPESTFNSINLDLDRVAGQTPLVTILVAAWNEEANILNCIASLSKTRFQESIEIIVIDNNSTDRTAEIVKKLNVTYLFEKKQGCGPARQLGQETAKGKYILLADADCLYPSCWVHDMIDVLKKPDVVCVYGRYSFISEAGFPRWKLTILEKMKDIITEFRQLNRPYYNAYGLSMGYIKKLGLKVGFIETNFWGDDGQLCLGLMKYGKVKQVRSNRARVWTGTRTLQRDGSLADAFKSRIKKEMNRFFKNFNSDLPPDATQKSKKG